VRKDFLLFAAFPYCLGLCSKSKGVYVKFVRKELEFDVKYIFRKIREILSVIKI